MSAIKLRDIRKYYHENDYEAVKGLSLDIPKGQFTVLVGPSGCGKSSLLRMMAGLEDITSGDIFFDGVRVNDLPPKKRDIGMVFQNYALYPHMSIYNNIAFPLKVVKTPKAEIDRKVKATAELTGITQLLDRKPKQISGGQRQRAALARAIVREPSIFLFDEPLSNLDAALRVQMRLEIAQLHRRIGATSVYVTHDQVEATTLGEQIVVMNEGRIMQCGTPAEIYRRPANLFVAAFIGQPQINLLRGKIEGGVFTSEGGGAKLVVGTPYNGSATIAIRPENIRITTQTEHTNLISGEVITSEYHGHEEIIYARVEGRNWAVRDSGDGFSGTVSLHLPERCILVYDGDSKLV